MRGGICKHEPGRCVCGATSGSRGQAPRPTPFFAEGEREKLRDELDFADGMLQAIKGNLLAHQMGVRTNSDPIAASIGVIDYARKRIAAVLAPAQHPSDSAHPSVRQQDDK